MFESPTSLPLPQRAAALVLAMACSFAFSGCGSGGSTGAPAPVIVLTPGPSLTFSSFIGLSSAPQTLTVTNTGSASLTITGIAVTGDFSESTSNCSVLPVNTYCTMAVVFTPTLIGTRTGTLTFSSNAAGGTTTVTLSGTGALGTPAMTVTPATLSFGTETIGQPDGSQLVTVTNSGTAVLTTSLPAVTGDYTYTSNGCTNATLPINGTCTLTVNFVATAIGSRPGTLTLTSNATPATQTVTLSGTGVTATSFTGLPFQTTVMAGSKTIAGATVQLYAAGTTGNGSTPTALLTPAIASTASGVVTIPAGYVCPAANSLVYLVARGGTVQGTSSANSGIALMTAIGTCNSIVSGAKYTVDEATTVAAVEGLSQFYAAGGLVGTSATNTTGLANAFATAATLADPVAGTSPGSALPANAASPAARVDSLANLLNACTVSSSACSTLFSSTTQGTNVPTNTLDAAFNITRNPANNVAALYTQSLASTAYAPVLTTVPTDWTMFLILSGGGLNSPSGIGVDSTGSVWVASYFGAASKFTPAGAAVFANGITSGGLNNSYGLSIDLSDNAWIPNEQPFTNAGIGSVSELSPTGTSLAGNGYINGGMNYPIATAIDPNGTVWVVDYGNSHVTLLSPNGTPISGTNGYTTPLFAFPVAVAVDGNHFGWIVNQSSNYLTKVAPDGSSFTNYNCCNLASGIAIDQGNNLWVANYFGDSVSLMTNAGTVISSSLTGGKSIYHPQGIAVDGAGTVWVTNYRAGYITELAGSTAAVPGTALSPANVGLGGDSQLLEAYAVALDASGNIWISNQGNNTVTKFIGLAVPVKTPLSGLPKLP